jgi:hypothetical protein
MPNALSEMSVSQLKRAIEIKERIDALQAELNELLGGAAGGKRGRPPGRPRGRGRPRAGGGMSEEGRARIAAAQKARWAKQKTKSGGGDAPVRKKRKVTAAGRARLAKAAKERWAKARAEGRTTL